MSDLSSAIVGASAVIVVGYVSNILKEDYVRFLDGRALASALAGELTGHREGLSRGQTNLTDLIAAKQKGQTLQIRPFATATSPVFESLVGKLGLLGSPLVGEVAYLYERIRSFRINYSSFSAHVESMSSDEVLARLEHLKTLAVESVPLADKAIADLNAYAGRRFLPWLADRLGMAQLTGSARGRQVPVPTINPTQGDDPSGSAR